MFEIQVNEVNFPNDEQLDIIVTPYNENIIVTACAGSGKTSVMIERAQRHIEDLKKCYKNIAIISFTSNSVDDIYKKTNHNRINVQTFHGFVSYEILCFDSKLKSVLNQSKETLKYNFREHAINGSMWKKTLYDSRLCIGTQDNSQDYLLEHCLSILEESNGCREYLKAKYECIYIDEVQDNNQLQYKYIEYFMGLGIRVYLTGDPEQTVFAWRGANKRLFINYLNDDRFIVKRLSENFRCHKYINELANAKQFPNKSESKVDELGGYTFTNKEVDSIVEKYTNKGIAILRHSINDDEITARYMELGFKKIRKPKVLDLSENNLLNIFMKNYFNEKNNYMFFNEIMYANPTKKILKSLADAYKNPNQQTINEFNNYLNKEVDVTMYKSEDIQKICESLIDKEVENYYTYKKEDAIFMTIHSAKGLEFESVIIYENDFFWSNGNKKSGFDDLFYVACTRAKKRLYILK